ncbi:MAG: metal-dependent hydrolase [Panacagrimonas sp.]
MNAINHAATALLINRRWPGVPLIAVLVSVQLIECLWVALNLFGLERTTTELQVQSLADIHLAHMPYSHSMASTVAIAALVWWLTSRVFRKPGWTVALAVGVMSHMVLDLATHVPDIQLAPSLESPRFGAGLYGIPAVALFVETLYGIWCWRVFRGSKPLLAAIVLLNLGALSFYVPQVPGPEIFLAGHPKIFAAVIGLHILTGWIAIGFFARTHWRKSAGGFQSVAAAA